MAGLRSPGTLPEGPGCDNRTVAPKSWQDRRDEPAGAPALSRGGRGIRLGLAVDADGRRPHAPEHRPRVRRSLGRSRHRAAPAVRRRPARGVELRRPGRVVRPLRELARAPAAWRAAIGSRCCSSPPCPSTGRSSASSSGARSPCRSSRCSGPTRSARASRTASARVLLTGPEADPVVDSFPGLAVWRVDEPAAGATGGRVGGLPGRARRPTTWRSCSTRRARHARCPRGSRTPIARSSRS